MTTRVVASWFGDEIVMRKNRAEGRATIAIATEVVNDTKRVTHVESGTLRRSVHAAPAGYDGSRDEVLAETSGIQSHEHATHIPGVGHGIEVGSWLPYACVEWVGRGHPGITQGLEMARFKAGMIVKAAFRAEGLA